MNVSLKNVSMVLALLIVAGMLIVAPVIGAIIGIIGGIINSGKPCESSKFHKDSVERPWLYFGDDSDTSFRSTQYRKHDPFDNHWESSFDCEDKDNDGYDDRDDGFWNEREF